MANFITVLNKNLNKSIWIAVQWGDTIDAVRNNFSYRSDVSMNLPKSGSEEFKDERDIQDILTGGMSSSTIIKLTTATREFIKIASNTISEKKLSALKKNIKS